MFLGPWIFPHKFAAQSIVGMLLNFMTRTDIRIIRFRYKILRLSGKEYGDYGDVDEDHSNDNNHGP